MLGKVYLAGFDVFRQDAVAHGQKLVSLCAQKNLEGLYPLDNACPSSLSGAEAAAWIAQANVEAIERADFLLVNLGAFRGYEPDSGTAFEFGYANALKKPIFVYFEDHRSLVQQIPNQGGVDADGFSVEDFGLAKNLMLSTRWAGAAKTFEGALDLLIEYIQHPAQNSEEK